MGRPAAHHFTDRADFYARARPGYPPELIHFFQNDLGLNASWRIADIGAGTGIFSKLLLETGACVIAIEPNADMRHSAIESLGKNTRFSAVDATAEATTLVAQSVEMITCAQSFHWFDRVRAKDEFKRILHPPGWVLLVWNERQADDPFGIALDELTHEFRPADAPTRKCSLKGKGDSAFVEFFSPAEMQTAMFSHSQSLDLAGLQGLILSRSYMPLEGQAKYEAMMNRVKQIYTAHQSDGALTIKYRTRVFYGRMA
jgi:ubiquinone/menaquinone biosynthesis C-methylase UbiE